MLENSIWLIVIVFVLASPWPPLSNVQIDTFGTLFLALYCAALVFVGASHYIFFIANAEYTLSIMILFIMSVLLRRQWRHSLATNVEMALLVSVVNTMLTIAESLIMCFGSDMLAAGLLLVPVVAWEFYAIRIHYGATRKIVDVSAAGATTPTRAPRLLNATRKSRGALVV